MSVQTTGDNEGDDLARAQERDEGTDRRRGRTTAARAGRQQRVVRTRTRTTATQGRLTTTIAATNRHARVTAGATLRTTRKHAQPRLRGDVARQERRARQGSRRAMQRATTRQILNAPTFMPLTMMVEA